MKKPIIVLALAALVGCAAQTERQSREGFWDAQYEQTSRYCRAVGGVVVQTVEREIELRTAKREPAPYDCRR